MISAIVSRIVILLFGTLYPAYASYKAVRTKNVKEYVKWMMYWIVFAFFTCIETFTDILLSWFPFYYEIKVILVLWLLSPATRGSSTLYRKFVHPMLTRREQEIDDYINQAKEKGYTAVLQLGSKGVNYATNVIMQTAIKGGGGLVQTLRKSYSLSDLSEPDTQRTQDEVDEMCAGGMGIGMGGHQPRVLRSKSARSSSGGRHVEMYFPEVELAGTPHRNAPPPYNYIRSSDDISSGYSSAEPGLNRTASMSNTAAVRPRVKSKTREDDDVDEVFYDGRDVDRFYGNGSSAQYSPAPSAMLYELPPSPLPAITQTPAFVPESRHSAPVYAQSPSGVGAAIPPEMDQKYEQFLRWMESQKTAVEVDPANTEIPKVEQVQVSASPDPVVDGPFLDKGLLDEKEEFRIETPPMMTPVPEEQEQSERSFVEDEFRDTISVSSGEDEFLEVEADEEVAEVVVDEVSEIPSVIETVVEEKQEASLEESIPFIDDKDTPETVPESVAMIPESVPEIVMESNTSTVESNDKQEIVADLSTLEASQPPSDNLNQLNVSISNLTSSTSSLATSEASSHHDESHPKKALSHGKRKAPPVPTPTTTPEPPVPAPSAVPKPPERVHKPAVPPPPVPKKSPALPESSQKPKSKKLMSSITGMFKHDSPSSSSGSGPKRPAEDPTLPRETEI
ncbi:titin isoform X1 [Culex quinquefasciatus]|uniref:titin isoform X1 n=1 Tax=Culex quinquefasciatus TaxID=7176 RepID=UPI0018E3784B|nr:titin isoform X1 [Culex quinquefasciatus]